jgi:sporulation protein YlmC with PRC-barrel domain
LDPSRLATLLTFDVRNANGDVLGDIENMVIDLGTAQVRYVIIASGGFLGIGEQTIPVPWTVASVNPACISATQGMGGAGGTAGAGTTTGTAVPGSSGTGATTGTAEPGTGSAAGGTGAAGALADACYFLLNVDEETLTNAPALDIGSLPDMSTPDWNTEINEYWETTGVTGGTAAGGETTTGTATPATGGTGATTGTATPGTAGAGTTTGATTQLGDRLILADELIGMTVTAATGAAGGSTTGGSGAAAGTSTPGTGGATAGTSTPGAGGTTGTATPGTGGAAGGATTGEEGIVLGTVTDAIVNLGTGDIRYLILSPSADLNMEGQAIPVPLTAFQPGAAGDAADPLTLTLDQTALSTAPSFDEMAFPNTSIEGWDAEIETYWQDMTTTTSP